MDIRNFGGYISANSPHSAARCSAGSPKVSLDSPGDYKNGQGIVVYGCGSLPALKSPGKPTVTPGTDNGNTVWRYKVIAEDYQGGYTASGEPGTTSSGPREIGLKSNPVVSAFRKQGQSTYSTKSPHDLRPGSSVYICGFGGPSCQRQTLGDVFNGTKVVVSVPSPTTFTVNDGNVFDASETPQAAKMWLRSCNVLSFLPRSASGYDEMLRYWVYRAKEEGPYALVGVALGLDPFFSDCGGRPPTPPEYIPSTPPTRPGAGYLAAVVSEGAGTTTLTLGSKAQTTVLRRTALHDNSSALLAAMRQAQAQGGGTIYIPSFESGNASWNFTAATIMPSVQGASFVTILVNGTVGLDQPWILRDNVRIEGMTKRNSSFMYPGGAHFGSRNGYPLLYVKKKSSLTLRNLFLDCGGAQCTDFFADTDGGGNGSVGVIAENVDFGNAGNGENGTARNVIIKGGFDYFFRQVTCDAAPGRVILPAPCINFTDSSAAVESASQIAGRIRFDYYYAGESGVQIDSIPNGNAGGGSTYYFNGVLAESMLMPFLRIGPLQQTASDFHVEDLIMADQIAGSGTPLIEASGARVGELVVTGGISTQGGGQPIVIASEGYGPGLFSIYQPTLNSGNTPWFAIRQNALNGPMAPGMVTELNNQPLNALGSGHINYAMSAPDPAVDCKTVAGGSIVSGSHVYALSAVDYDGNETVLGAPATVVLNGKENISCRLPPLPNGAVGYNVYRDGFRIFVGGTCNSPQVTTDFSDINRGCGQSQPAVNAAGSSFISRSGISTYRLRISGETLTAAPRSVLAAFLPGALTAKWTAATWTLDKAVIVTRMQAQLKSAPVACSRNAVLQLSDGKTNVRLDISQSSNDSGLIGQNYPAGATLSLRIEDIASGCATAPADANVIVQYRTN